MDKKIKQLVMMLKIEFYSCWAICILLYIIFKNYINVFDGIVEPHSQDEYVVQMVCVAGVLLGIPLALKLFTLNTKRNLKRMNYDEALTNYNIWSVIRQVIIFAVAMLGMFGYFASYNMSCGVCTLMAMCSTFLCYPTEEKVKTYLDNLNEEV